MSKSAARMLMKARTDEVIGALVRRTGRSREEVLQMPREEVEVAAVIWKLDAQAELKQHKSG